MLDLSFGLPITIRDAALKMIAPGPGSSINREYYAQEHEKEIEEGRGGLEAYDKTDEKAMDLLKRLARSEPYHKKRRIEEDVEGPNMKALLAPEALQEGHTPGPVRTANARGGGRPRGAMRGGRGGARGGRVFPSTAQLPPSESDWLPPPDTNIKSLFVVGIEDDLPEYKIREFFTKYGTLQSAVISHRSHCGYINYVKREDAEEAANNLRGRGIIAGCPLRVTWGKPKQLDTMDRDQRMQNAREGRAVAQPRRQGAPGRALTQGEDAGGQAATADELGGLDALAPPGQDEVNYASLAGD